MKYLFSYFFICRKKLKMHVHRPSWKLRDYKAWLMAKILTSIPLKMRWHWQKRQLKIFWMKENLDMTKHLQCSITRQVSLLYMKIESFPSMLEQGAMQEINKPQTLQVRNSMVGGKILTICNLELIWQQHVIEHLRTKVISD